MPGAICHQFRPLSPPRANRSRGMVTQSAHAGESVRVPVWRAVLRICLSADGQRLSSRPSGPASIAGARVVAPPSVLELRQNHQQHEGASLFSSPVFLRSADGSFLNTQFLSGQEVWARSTGLAEPKTIASPVTADLIYIEKTAAEMRRPSSSSSESQGVDRPIIARKNAGRYGLHR
jgi:hypothetical protein